MWSAQFPAGGLCREVIRLPHWSFSEMEAAFGGSLEQDLFYGGYPGAASLITDPERWVCYIGCRA